VEKDEALAGLQGLLPRLNAYDATLVDEPDYDVRLAAFAEVNEVRATLQPAKRDCPKFTAT
jgi:hypothetical protein